MTRLHVDRRYTGTHGIARYAHEVLTRLTLDTVAYSPASSPTSAASIVDRARRRIPADDVLYSPGYGVGLARCRQVPTIHDLIHLVEPDGSGLKYRLYYDRVVRPALRRSGLVFTVSETSRADLETWLDDDRIRVVNTGNGCSDAFTPDGPATVASRPYLLFVGNTKRHKNLVTALRALHALPDLDLVCVCPSDEDPVGLAEAEGVARQVSHRHGLTDAELAELYRGATALVMPSLIEGFGLPVAEAISCATPVVYFRGCRSVAEICGDGQHPFDDASDAGQLAAAVLRAAASPRERPVTGRFDWSDVARTVQSTLVDHLRRGDSASA